MIKNSYLYKRTHLAKKDILYYESIELKSNKIVGIKISLNRKKIDKMTKFYPETKFAYPFYKDMNKNKFKYLYDMDGLTAADHYEIVTNIPKIYGGDADDRDIEEKLKNLGSLGVCGVVKNSVFR